jgi:hypothetical protein
MEPWTAINFGDSSQAAFRKYMIPDVDSDAVKESLAKRNAAMWASITSARENGMAGQELQTYANTLAEEYEVTAPVMAVAAPAEPATPGDAQPGAAAEGASSGAGLGL